MTMFVLLCQVQLLALLLADRLLLLIRAEPGGCFGAQLIQSPFIGLGPLYHLQSRSTLTLLFITLSCKEWPTQAGPCREHECKDAKLAKAQSPPAVT